MNLSDGPYNRDISDTVTNSSDLSRRMIHLNNVPSHFWKRWKKKYLLELRESHRTLKPGSINNPSRNISNGDVVLIHNETQPRGFWKLGHVKNVMTGSDGNIRGASIKTLTSSNQPTFLRCPLEVRGDSRTEQTISSEPDQ